MTSALQTPDCGRITTHEAAMTAGYTSAVIADCSMHTLELLIKPGTDLDGRFTAYDRNEQEMLTVNGWLFDISPE